METPKSPTSPVSPTSAHPLDDGFIPRPPQLQVVTNFPLNSVHGRRPSASRTILAPTSNLTSPQTPNPGFRAHCCHRRTRSSLSFPSPIEAILMQPLSSLPTPPSPHARMTIDALLNPLSAHEMDGRQSRMAVRSPALMSACSPMSLSSPTPITARRSPILEQVLSLPVRLNITFQNPPSPMSMDSCMDTFSSTTTAVPSSRPQSRSTSRASSRSRWTPTHSRSPAISHAPSSTLTGPRDCSPIRKSGTSIITTSHRRKRSPPPKYRLTLAPSLASTLNGPPSSFQPHLHPHLSPASQREYRSAIDHLSTPLVPLISVTNGLPHPQFPRSLLQYHLLTHDQLDQLARWYHQAEPRCEETFMYPAWIPPYTSTAAAAAGGGPRSDIGQPGVESAAGLEYRPSSQFKHVTLATKRRRWGRFIGLRGCESPTATATADDGQCQNLAGGDATRERTEQEQQQQQQQQQDDEEGLVERMEREWRNAMRRARDEEMLREKSWRGRW